VGRRHLDADLLARSPAPLEGAIRAYQDVRDTLGERSLACGADPWLWLPAHAEAGRSAEMPGQEVTVMVRFRGEQ
jgi:hypothetical protein